MKILLGLIFYGLLGSLGLKPMEADAVLPSARWQICNPTVTTALHNVINEQLAAFRQQDYARAYTFAAADLHRILPVKAFQTLVKTRYAVIDQNIKTAFGPAVSSGRKAILYVQLLDGTGREEIYQYRLILEEKSWKIQSVVSVETFSQTI